MAQVARGTGRFGTAYEGAPGLLHGGSLAAAFDELLGVATVFSGGPGRRVAAYGWPIFRCSTPPNTE